MNTRCSFPFSHGRGQVQPVAGLMPPVRHLRVRPLAVTSEALVAGAGGGALPRRAVLRSALSPTVLDDQDARDRRAVRPRCLQAAARAAAGAGATSPRCCSCACTTRAGRRWRPVGCTIWPVTATSCCAGSILGETVNPTEHELVATGTTGSMLHHEIGLEIDCVNSGPRVATCRSAPWSPRAASTC